MGYEVLEVQTTPNPNALKFILDRSIAERPVSFFDPEKAYGHPLAVELFAVDGVASLLLLHDFLTVNKRPQASWSPIKAEIRKILKRSHLNSR